MATRANGSDQGRLEALAVTLIIGIAAWVRLRNLGLSEFKWDEMNFIWKALPIVRGQALPEVGVVSSVGVNYPPLFLYLIALPLFYRVDPLLVGAFIACSNVLAILLTYRCVRSRLGPFVAVAAAALMATGPWAVVLSRKVWAMDLVPVFTAALLACLFGLLERSRSWLCFLLPVLVCAICQVHYSGGSLLGVVAGVLLYRARHLHRGALALGVGAALLMLVPWLHFEIESDWQDLRQVLSIAKGESELSTATERPSGLRAIVYTGKLAGAAGWRSLTGASEAAFERSAPGAILSGNAASALAIGLFFAGLAASGVKVVRGARRTAEYPFVELPDGERARALLILWLASVWCFFGLIAPRVRLASNYFVATYPVSFVLAALALDDLRRSAGASRRPAADWAAIATLSAVTASFLTFDLGFQRYLAVNGGTSGGYGVTYVHKAAVADYALCLGVTTFELGGGVGEIKRLSQVRALGGSAEGSCAGVERASKAVLEVRSRLNEAGGLPCPEPRARSFGPIDTCVRPAVGAAAGVP